MLRNSWSCTDFRRSAQGQSYTHPRVEYNIGPIHPQKGKDLEMGIMIDLLLCQLIFAKLCLQFHPPQSYDVLWYHLPRHCLQQREVLQEIRQRFEEEPINHHATQKPTLVPATQQNPVFWLMCSFLKTTNLSWRSSFRKQIPLVAFSIHTESWARRQCICKALSVNCGNHACSKKLCAKRVGQSASKHQWKADMFFFAETKTKHVGTLKFWTNLYKERSLYYFVFIREMAAPTFCQSRLHGAQAFANDKRWDQREPEASDVKSKTSRLWYMETKHRSIFMRQQQKVNRWLSTMRLFHGDNWRFFLVQQTMTIYSKPMTEALRKKVYLRLRIWDEIWLSNQNMEVTPFRHEELTSLSTSNKKVWEQHKKQINTHKWHHPATHTRDKSWCFFSWRIAPWSLPWGSSSRQRRGRSHWAWRTKAPRWSPNL